MTRILKSSLYFSDPRRRPEPPAHPRPPPRRNLQHAEPERVHPRAEGREGLGRLLGLPPRLPALVLRGEPIGVWERVLLVAVEIFHKLKFT